MVHRKKEDAFSDPLAIHEYYMEIMNGLPDIVYWVDTECQLKGCNHRFVEWIGLKRLQDFEGTPYEQMAKLTTWPSERIDTLKFSDMSVLFSGQAQYKVLEPSFTEEQSPKQNTAYWATRIPLHAQTGQVIGLAVILTAQPSASEPLSSAIKPPTKKTARTSKKSHVNGHMRVLIVEDQVITQTVEKALLMTLNCQVDVANSGDEALALFKPGQYDLILMDIGLQETSGYAVSKKIRKKEQGTSYHVPIIALTMFDTDVVKYDCQAYSMEGVMRKPLTREQAEDMIKQYVH